MKNGMQRFALLTWLVIGVAGMLSGQQSATGKALEPVKGYAPVNGLKMYYEVHGSGKPLLLLHGSFMTIGLNYGTMIPELAKEHRVIAVEFQGHGHTADIDRPISYTNIAEDVAGVLKYLKVDSANVLGYSLGATVALQLAILHPEMVQRIIFISSAYSTGGWTPAVQDAIKQLKPEFLTNSPLKTEYDKIAPDRNHWNKFLEKMITFEHQAFDLGREEVDKIKSPILIIKGDNDGVDYAHTAELYRMFGGDVFADMQGVPASHLAIIPGTSHVSLMMQTKQLLSFILPFLK
jgi:pimeloyl-ACP methyl ester carboxylesterase